MEILPTHLAYARKVGDGAIIQCQGLAVGLGPASASGPLAVQNNSSHQVGMPSATISLRPKSA
jgi:hypothetical protein